VKFEFACIYFLASCSA